MSMEVIDADVFPLIEQSRMPQISSKQYPALFVFLGSKGLTFTAGYISPAELKFRQEVDVTIAANIPVEKLAKPILIAKDNFILDGDHRGYRHHLDGTAAPFIRIGCTFSQAMALLFQFPGTNETEEAESSFPLLPAPGEA